MRAEIPSDTAAKLSRLLPRLASDHDGEVVATARAVRRALDGAGLDLHDLAGRLTGPVVIYRDRPRADARDDRAQPRADACDDEGGDLRRIAEALATRAMYKLSERQAAFVRDARRLLAARAKLSEKQAQWLRVLYARHVGEAPR